MCQLVVREALQYLDHRLGDKRSITLDTVKKTYDLRIRGDHVSVLPARRRMLRIMFGTAKPDLRCPIEEGKVWFGELASMIDSDTSVKGVALAEHARKAGVRDFGGGKGSSYPRHDQREAGPKSGGYPTPSIPPQPYGNAPWRTRAKGKGSSKARVAGYSPKASSWWEEPAPDSTASSSP